jgi:hypothetical protein
MPVFCACFGLAKPANANSYDIWRNDTTSNIAQYLQEVCHETSILDAAVVIYPSKVAIS